MPVAGEAARQCKRGWGMFAYFQGSGSAGLLSASRACQNDIISRQGQQLIHLCNCILFSIYSRCSFFILQKRECKECCLEEIACLREEDILIS